MLPTQMTAANREAKEEKCHRQEGDNGPNNQHNMVQRHYDRQRNPNPDEDSNH
jgi:hypothetical protein